jgi:hypothetical protein
MTELEYMAARIAFGIATANEIQSIVDALLKDGFYSDEFIAITDSKPTRLAEVLEPFKTYLQSQGISIPTKEKAVWQLITYHVARISSGQDEPLVGLQNLISDVYWDYDFGACTKEVLGDSHGIEQLVGLYWGYDDIMERPQEVSLNGKYGDEAISETKKQIVKAAEAWIEKYEK